MSCLVVLNARPHAEDSYSSASASGSSIIFGRQTGTSHLFNTQPFREITE